MNSLPLNVAINPCEYVLGDAGLFCAFTSKKAMSTGWPMQNWYSQNNPFKSRGGCVGKGVEIGMNVGSGMAVSVAATAWLICELRPVFGEQAVRIMVMSVNR